MDAGDPSERVQAAVEANAGDLLAYFVRRFDLAEDAADLLSETLLAVWRRAESMPDDMTEARMWMYGVARNVLSTHRRTTGRRSALHDRLRSELAGTGGGTPADPRVDDVSAAVRRLDPVDREIVRLTYWDGFTQAQAAALLGMPEGTVRSRTHRARSRLRDLLGEQSLASPRRTGTDLA